ncbi:MAG: hypothetical protein FJ297_04080 [Planctomycetes bacterium]|nr:hypothetical protein [Planctomycetota bacterium]
MVRASRVGTCLIMLWVSFAGGCAEPTAPPVAPASNDAPSNASPPSASSPNTLQPSRPDPAPAVASNTPSSSGPPTSSPTPAPPKVNLPDDYPQDVPVLPGATQVNFERIDGATRLTLSTSGHAAEVVEYYRQALIAQSWQPVRLRNLRGPLMYSPYASAIAFKPNRVAVIEAFKSQNDATTTLSVTVELESPLPEDVPVYPGSVFRGTFFRRENAYYSSGDSPDTIYDHFKNTLPKHGWVFVGRFQLTPTILSGTYRKGGRELSLEFRGGLDEMSQVEPGETLIEVQLNPVIR